MIPRRLVAASVAATALALPAAASAMPIDNGGPPAVHRTSPPPPEIRTVVHDSNETLPLALAGAALLVAMASAGYSVANRAPRGQAA
jgi:hypothetical protein